MNIINSFQSSEKTKLVVNRIALLLIWASSILWLTAGAAQAKGNDPIKSIEEKGELVIAVVNNIPAPFIMQDDTGKWVGIETELAENIASYLGVKPVFLRSARTPQEAVEQVLSGQADIAIPISPSLCNEQKLSHFQPLT